MFNILIRYNPLVVLQVRSLFPVFALGWVGEVYALKDVYCSIRQSLLLRGCKISRKYLCAHS